MVTGLNPLGLGLSSLLERRQISLMDCEARRPQLSHLPPLPLSLPHSLPFHLLTIKVFKNLTRLAHRMLLQDSLWLWPHLPLLPFPLFSL
jgi:hypothetical protein